VNRDFPIKLIGASFWLAPVLMFLSDLCGLVFSDRFFWIATHLFWLSFYSFLGLIYGMVQLLRYSSYSVISGLIAGFGALIGITIIGMARYAWGIEMEEIGSEVLASAHSNTFVFFSSRATGITFPIGLMMLAMGLKRNNLISVKVFAGLLISILLFPVGRISGQGIFNVIGDGLMVISFGHVGWVYLQKMR